MRISGLTLNALLRLALFLWVLHTGGYLGGDSEYYFIDAHKIALGDWGGGATRTPLYSHFLFLLGSKIPLILFFQSFAVWLVGFFLHRRGARTAAFLWLYEPALLAYSTIVMSDALFAVSMTGVAASVELGLLQPGQPKTKSAALIGFSAAIATLVRSVGSVIGLWTIVFFVIWGFRRKVSLKIPATIALAFALTLSPRLYWNHQEHGRWFIANQGSWWIQEIAGIVENSGQGLDFFHAQEKWYSQHVRTPGEAAASLIRYWPRWVRLSSKGGARVWMGSANVEWTTILTGNALLGPGWFHEGEADTQRRVHGFGIAFWVLGLVVSLLFCMSAYTLVAKKALGENLDLRYRAFLTWAALSALMLSLIPQVYGDSRFRLPVWALICFCLAIPRVHSDTSSLAPKI